MDHHKSLGQLENVKPALQSPRGQEVGSAAHPRLENAWLYCDSSTILSQALAMVVLFSVASGGADARAG